MSSQRSRPPPAYPGHPRTVERHETHCSWVFVAGEHALKIKLAERLAPGRATPAQVRALGARIAALADWYREAGGDPGDAALLAPMGAYRALVRAKVGALLGEAGRVRARIEQATALAWRAREPLVLAICGAPSTRADAYATAAVPAGWPSASRRTPTCPPGATSSCARTAR